MKSKILLVATVDEAYHQLLLESQGYTVHKASMQEAPERLFAEQYDLVLVTPEEPMNLLVQFCAQVRAKHPRVRVVLIARRAEYVPSNDAVHAVIREQSTPGKLLATIRKTIEGSAEKAFGASPEEDD